MGVLTENGALAKELLDEYMQGFQERNPTLRVFGAFLHMDEATPHLHIDFVPYVSGWKGKGLDTKVSLKQALKALGFAGGSKRESELNQWINSEKEQLAKVMERHGIEWEQKGTHEEHLSVLDFKKQERTKEVAALEAAKQERQADLAEMQEQLETVQTAADVAEQRAQQANKAYQKQSKELNKLRNTWLGSSGAWMDCWTGRQEGRPCHAKLIVGMSMLERSLEKAVELGSEWLYETKFSGPQAEAAMERVASQQKLLMEQKFLREGHAFAAIS